MLEFIIPILAAWIPFWNAYLLPYLAGWILVAIAAFIHCIFRR